MKLTVVFSDIEIGSGTVTDDFVEDELFKETIISLIKDSRKQETDLVLNGDVFDFLKVPYGHIYPRHVTEKISLAKLEDIIKAHPKFFLVLRKFLKASKTNKVIFVVGNHDYDIVYPKVQKRIKDELCKEDKVLRKRVVFPGFEFTDGLVHIEHGSQLDSFFRVDPSNFLHPGTKWLPEPFLLLPWGVNVFYDVVIHMKEEFPLTERLQPKEVLIKKLPWKLKKQLVFGIVFYIIKSFFVTQFTERHDPLRRFRAADFWLYVKPFFKMDFHLSFLNMARRKLALHDFKVISVGHNHTSSVYKIGDKTILNTGNWRDEYFYSSEIDEFIPKIKSYGYVLHDKNKVIKCELREVVSKQSNISGEGLTEDVLRNRRVLE